MEDKPGLTISANPDRAPLYSSVDLRMKTAAHAKCDEYYIQLGEFFSTYKAKWTLNNPSAWAGDLQANINGGDITILFSVEDLSTFTPYAQTTFQPGFGQPSFCCYRTVVCGGDAANTAVRNALTASFGACP